MDENGRLKVPAQFFQYLSQKYGLHVFVTSTTGDFVRVYPMEVWEELERRLEDIPDSLPAKEKYLNRLQFYGQSATLDRQGRLVIHPHLRDRAQTTGEVAVLGKSNFLEVWNRSRFVEILDGQPLTEEDRKELAAYKV